MSASYDILEYKIMHNKYWKAPVHISSVIISVYASALLQSQRESRSRHTNQNRTNKKSRVIYRQYTMSMLKLTHSSFAFRITNN